MQSGTPVTHYARLVITRLPALPYVMGELSAHPHSKHACQSRPRNDVCWYLETTQDDSPVADLVSNILSVASNVNMSVNCPT